MPDFGHFQFSKTNVIVPLLGMIIIWLVYWMELQMGINLNDFGILPRTVSGLKGVLFSPFIHGSLEHLYNNTIPLGILLMALFYFYRNLAWRILFYGVLLSGFLTWCIGRTSYHIGASGLIYVLASFIFFKGVFSSYFRLIALSLIVVFIYGSLLWYIFPVKEGISWEGHLSGFLTGLLLAIIFKVHIPVHNKYDWENEDYNEDEDPFLKHFDENGNFRELPVEDEIEKKDTLKITYIYKESPDHKDKEE